MNQLRVLSLTLVMLMLPCRLLGQGVNGENWDGLVTACNDGTISFSVARAYRDSSGHHWQIEGWYNVDPGKCKEIGPYQHYYPSGLFSEASVTLLAFAFYDSTGKWGAAKFQLFDRAHFSLSNQQFCVPDENFKYAFRYERDSPGANPPRACDGAQTGYQMIPVAYEYSGPVGLPRLGYSAEHELHVKLGPSDRAIPMGKPTSSGEASRSSGGAGSSQSNNASPSLCGPVSCSVLQELRKGVRDAEAQRAAAANHNLPSPAPPAAAPPPVVSRAPAAAPPVHDDHPIFLVVICVAENLDEKYSYNHPPAGSKMAAFESTTQRYIRSIAKPGWEYWIGEAQFQNFDVQTTAPEALVSQISPESGRFDTSRPDCPSNYKWYQLPIQR